MLSPELQKLLKPILVVQKILWAALTLSIFAHVAAAFFVLSGSTGGGPARSPAVAPLFYTLAMGAALFSVLYRRRAFSEERLRARLREEHTFGLRHSGDVTSPRLAARLQAVEDLPPADRRLLFLAGSLTVPIIVCLVINEAIAILGLVLAFTSVSATAAVPFGAVALVLNFMMFPRTAEILTGAQGWAALA